MNSCIRIKCHWNSKVTERMMMYSCIPACWRVCFLFFPLHLPKQILFLQDACRIFFFFSVFLNVILVSYKSEIAFQPLTPDVFLSKWRLLHFFFCLFCSSRLCQSCWSQLLLYSQYKKVIYLIKQCP